MTRHNAGRRRDRRDLKIVEEQRRWLDLDIKALLKARYRRIYLAFWGVVFVLACFTNRWRWWELYGETPTTKRLFAIALLLQGILAASLLISEKVRQRVLNPSANFKKWKALFIFFACLGIIAFFSLVLSTNLLEP
jgi:hypothetical protein